MISLEESIPKKSARYLEGQDILWMQFNEVNFYVEDVHQENLYFKILTKLFPDVKFNKIFPLGGKDNVITKARKNVKNKKKVFILDLDFDNILGKRESLDNVFYLERYSIENYLIEKDAIYEILKEEKPKLKNQDIYNIFSLPNFMAECRTMLTKLSCNFLLIQKYELGVEYHKLVPNRDCDYASNPVCLKDVFLNDYYLSVQAALRRKKARLKYSTQIQLLAKYFRSKCLSNVPGKYILNILKSKLEVIFKVKLMSLDSFTYRLAKNCSFEALKSLQKDISSFVRVVS